MDEQGGFISTEFVRGELNNEGVVVVTPSTDGAVIQLNGSKSAFQKADGTWEQVGPFTNFRINAVSTDEKTFVGAKYPGLPVDSTGRAAIWTANKETVLPLIPGTESYWLR
jgi:hypothetical protein